MLGLQRGTVRLGPHDDTWPQEAARTIRQLREILGATAVDIQHVGSTAIPLIEAKPILDLAVGVRALADLQPALPALARQGFLFRGEMVPGERLLVMGTADTRTHHIHVVVWNGERWRDYLNFRDYLNAHPGKALQYEACKRRLAALEGYGDYADYVLCRRMADCILFAVQGENDRIPPALVTNHLLSGRFVPQTVTFSGGVAACMTGQHDAFQYKDLGVLLAGAVQSVFAAFSGEVIQPQPDSIRATVIGAGNFHMEVSGSTIFYQNICFPLKNLACGRPRASRPGTLCRTRSRTAACYFDQARFFQGARLLFKKISAARRFIFVC